MSARSKAFTTWRAMLLLAAIVLGAWMAHRLTMPTSDKMPALSAKNVAGSVKSSSVFPGFKLQPGDQLAYTFSTQGTLSLGANDATSASTLQISESGQFHVKIYAATASGWLAGFAWEKIKLTVDSGQNLRDLTPDDLAANEIFVALDKSGRITQVQVPYTLSSEARNNWRDVLSKWQVILPSDAAKKWTRIEDDATGAYIAQYALTAEGLAKRKTHYLRINAANAALAAAYKISGTAQIQFDNFPRAIQGTENVDLGGVNGLPPTSSTGEYTFTLDSQTNTGSFPPPNTTNYTTMTWATEFNAVAAPPEDEGNLADNLRGLRASIQHGAFGGPEEIGLAGKLIGLIKKDPALADQLLDELHGDNVSTQLASALLGILGAAGTPAAQDDLLAVATSDDWPEPMRQMALYSYVQVAEPVAEADAALKNLFAQGGDLSSSALLVLAALGDKVRTSDPARFQQINDEVARVMNSPGLSLNDFVVALEAVGNLGPAQVPDVVAKATTNESELIRAKAITSLARIQTETALGLVTKAINNDPSGDVQAAGVKTLAALKGANAVPDLSTIAVNGKSVAARKEALTQLTNFTGTNPTINAVLNTAAQSDPSSEVRDYASKLVNTHGQSPIQNP